MQVVYTTGAPPSAWTGSLFLAGPSPRTASPMPSWRPRALEILRGLGFEGAVFVPEPPPGEPWPEDTDATTRWELEALPMVDVIAFWIPRDFAHMPGLTTNVEFGVWVDSGKVVLGRPPDAPAMSYLDRLATLAEGRAPADTLRATLERATSRIGDGAMRRAGERSVPLHVWRVSALHRWLDARPGRLVGARVEWWRTFDDESHAAVVDVTLAHGTTERTHTLLLRSGRSPVEVVADAG